MDSRSGDDDGSDVDGLELMVLKVEAGYGRGGKGYLEVPKRMWTLWRDTSPLLYPKRPELELKLKEVRDCGLSGRQSDLLGRCATGKVPKKSSSSASTLS